MLDFLSPIFGSKPQIADYTPVDMSQEQLDALQGNIAAWPEIQQLGSLYQQYMLDSYEKAIPGFGDILKMGGVTTKEMLGKSEELLKGEIPKDVQEQVQRSSAFQSLIGGTAGSGMAGALTARDLGRTSLDLIGQGADLAGKAGNAAQRWASLSGAQLPEGMLVTPQQQAALDMQQNLIKRNVQQQKYNVDAAPDPVMKGLSDLVANLTAAYLGGMGGGGMGGGGGGKGAPAAMTSQQFGVSDVSSPGYNVGGGGGGAFGGEGAGSSWNINGNAGYNYNAPNTGYDYGVGYPAANPDQYYGSQSPFSDYLYSSSYQQGAFPG